jgi:hypothetical protein
VKFPLAVTLMSKVKCPLTVILTSTNLFEVGFPKKLSAIETGDTEQKISSEVKSQRN